MNSFRYRKAMIIMAASVALGASLAATPASSNQIPVGNIQRSFAQPCEDFAQTKSQFAHRIGVDLNNKKINIRRLGPCKISYYGPVNPDFEVGKDEIVCYPGKCIGYGQRFKGFSNELTIEWLPSLRGFFAVDCQLQVQFRHLEEYIRHQGDASYWAGEFWDGGDGVYQDILYYAGPKRPFVVPISKLVQLPDGRIFSPCYYFRGGRVVAEGGMYGVTRLRDFANFGRLYPS